MPIEKNKVRLGEGESHCEDCAGYGWILTPFRVRNDKRMYKKRCDKCEGKGKLDWVEQITGSRSPTRSKRSVYIEPCSYEPESGED